MYKASKKRERFTLLIAVFVLGISCMVMSSWFLNIDALLNHIPEAATMKFNTSICFAMSGLGLLIWIRKEERFAMVPLLLALVILSIAGLTLVQHFFEVNLGIDTIVVNDMHSAFHPGRMSTATAICFSLYSLSVLGIYFRKSKAMVHIIETMLLLVLLIALMAVYAYILEIPSDEKFPFINSMAIHTSILFFLLALALSLRNSSNGSMGYFFGRLSGNIMVRWLLPFVILFPVLMGYWLIYCVNSQKMNMELGILVCCIVCSVVYTTYVGFLASKLNKSDRQRFSLETSLKESNQELLLLKHALDQSSIVAVTDAKGVLTYVNNKFCEISKYSREELIGQTHKIINSGYHSKEFFEELWAKIGSGNVWIGGIKNKAKDDTYYWVHAMIIPFKDDRGSIYQYLTIRQDITKLKLLSSQYENLKQRSKELRQFTYIASHDLQEPLNTTSSIVKMIKEQYWEKLDDEVKKLINFVGASSDRMTSLIKGLLDYSMIGKGHQLEETDCNEIFKNVVDDLGLKISKLGCEITTDSLPTINAYKTEFRLLVQNLISNAIKFRKPDASPKIHVSCTKGRTYWKFAISDNGIGIEKEHISKIFAMFQRLHKREDYSGTGIGLAHCERIVSLHGGHIWVESEPSIGSTFYFRIPVNLS